MKQKSEFSVRLDTELYKKLIYVAEKENNNLNNHMLHMIRQNVQYYEKVHGRINTANIKLEENTEE
jgi:predicted transcriptional regulator